MEFIIAYDIGTGGIKASLYGEGMKTLSKTFVEYPTYFPAPGHQEQKPSDWWNAFCLSTKRLLEQSSVNPCGISGLAISGASLVCIPFDGNGNALSDTVPIWSDKRACDEAEEFFAVIPEEDWYSVTGNGFPAPSYPLFKLMWLRRHKPEIFKRTKFVLGTKDYINYRLTGKIATDYSYCSGSGAYNLIKKRMEHRFLDAACIPASFFPEPQSSDTFVGTILPAVAKEIGLSDTTKVFLGGVDNACTALGTVGICPGKAYVSLGTSSWIPVNCTAPILDVKTKPYTFAHIRDDLFTSAYSIFSGGNSLRWMRDTLCKDIGGYDDITERAKLSPPGANGVMFQPGLAGGTTQDKSIYLRGGFFGITLGTTRNDMIRAVYEGVAFNLKTSLNLLKAKCDVSDAIVFCGGGSKSDFWLQVFADIFGTAAVRTNIDQDAATLGAAACAAKGLKWYSDYSFVEQLQKTDFTAYPNAGNARIYEKLFPLFEMLNEYASDYGDSLHRITKQ